VRLRALPAAGLVIVLASCTGTTPHPPTAPTGSRSAPTGLASQEFVYTVEENHGEGGTRSTVVIDVADPYVARVTTRTSQGSTGGSAWGASGLLVLAADGTARQVQPAPPGFTGGDSRLDVALPLAASLGWVRKGSATTKAGRACTMWRSGPPLDSGSIEPATPAESTDTCVDASGRIVYDSWVRRGQILRVRRLTSARPGPRLSPDGIDPGGTASPLPSAAATQLVRSVAATKLAPLMGVALPAAPAGEQLDRSTALAVTTPDGSAQREGASFTYVGTGSLTVVTFTRYLVGTARAPTRGQIVRLTGATGRVVPVLEGLEADLVTSRGLAVKVQTELALPQLTAWLEQLTL
jgi:hypothetical protein